MEDREQREEQEGREQGEEDLYADQDPPVDPERPQVGNSNARFFMPGEGPDQRPEHVNPSGVDPGEPQVGNSNAKFHRPDEGEQQEGGSDEGSGESSDAANHQRAAAERARGGDSG